MIPVLNGLNVSRETIRDLEVFSDLVIKWNPAINLISKGDVNSIWERHIQDSAQVYQSAPHFNTWVDLGSGGGFPALVCAILAKNAGDTGKFTLVESDKRKCAFLRTVIRDLGLNATVYADRIEAVPSLSADVVSARALSRLDTLLGYAFPHLDENGSCCFLKGEKWQEEVEIALREWIFDHEAHPSTVNPAAAVLEIRNLRRV